MYEQGDGAVYRAGLQKVINRRREGRFTCVLTGPNCKRSKVRNGGLWGLQGHIALHLYGDDVCSTQYCKGTESGRNERSTIITFLSPTYTK
jgi:hypothetical protein